MLEILLTVIPSLCWMAFRCYQVLRTPADRLARQLNIQIPHPPVISVNHIGRHDVSVRWHSGASLVDNIFFVVLVNGHDAGTVAHTCVRLSNLHPSTVYKIQILAVNVINNFRSQSEPVYVRTAGSDMPLPPISPPVGPSLRGSADLKAGDVESITNEAALQSHLSLYQAEIAHSLRDSEALSRRQHDEEEALQAEYNACKKELEDGLDFRTKKGSDLKGLEKTKDSLSFQKLKASKTLRNYELRRSLNERKIRDLHDKLKKSKEKAHHLHQVAASERLRIQQALASSHGELVDLKSRISELELFIQASAHDKSQMEALLSRLSPLVNQFVTGLSKADDVSRLADPPGSVDSLPGSADSRAGGGGGLFAEDGQLSECGAQLVSQILQLQPEWASQMHSELQELVSKETAWRQSLSAQLRNYTTVHNALESARSARDGSYVPSPLSEYRAGVAFGATGASLPRLTLTSPSPGLHGGVPPAACERTDIGGADPSSSHATKQEPMDSAMPGSRNMESRDIYSGTAMPRHMVELENMDCGNMDYGNMDYGNMDYGNMDYGNMDYGNMDYGNMDYGNMDYGNTEFGNRPSGNVESTGVESRSLSGNLPRNVFESRSMLESRSMPESIGMVDPGRADPRNLADPTNAPNDGMNLGGRPAPRDGPLHIHKPLANSDFFDAESLTYAGVYPGAMDEAAGLYGRGSSGSYMDFAAPSMALPSHMYSATDALSHGRIVSSDPYMRSPASEPSTLQSSAINVAGSSAIQNMSGTGAMQNMSGTGAIQNMSGPSSIQNMSGPSPLQNMSGPSPLQNMSGPSPMQNMSGPSPMQNMSGPSPMQNMSGPNAMQNIPGPRAIQNIPGSMWSSNMHTGYTDPRSPYSDLSRSPPLNVDPINVALSQNGPTAEHGLFSNLMLSSSHNSIWSSKPTSIRLGHSHSVSGGSPIWRDTGKRDMSPTPAFAPEFSPFSASSEAGSRRSKE